MTGSAQVVITEQRTTSEVLPELQLVGQFSDVVSESDSESQSGPLQDIVAYSSLQEARRADNELDFALKSANMSRDVVVFARNNLKRESHTRITNSISVKRQRIESSNRPEYVGNARRVSVREGQPREFYSPTVPLRSTARLKVNR